MTTATISPPTSTIRVTRNKGVGFQFDNGLYVSIQFGPNNYGSNRDLDYDQWVRYETSPMHGDRLPPSYRDVPPADTAEVAVIDKDGEWAWMDGFEEVAGYQTVVQVMTILVLAQSAKDLSSFQMAYWTAFPGRKPQEKTDE